VSEYRDALERQAERFDLPPGALDRLFERQRQKARNRRVAAAATAFLVAGVGIGVAAIAFRGRSQLLPPEPITPANVSSLQLVWTANLGAPTSAPVVSGDAVYLTAGEPGGNLKLYAFPTSCDSEACRPSWYAELGRTHRLTRPAVAAGRVFATGDRLYAFTVRCEADGGRCDPIWTTRSTRPALYSSPAVAESIVYVTTGRGLEAYRASGAGSDIRPLWRGPSGASLNPPAVGGGNVYTVSHSMGLSAYAVECGMEGETCQPLWRAIVASSDSAGVTATDRAVYATAARLYSFSTDCGSPRCDLLWLAKGIRSIGITPPVLSGGEVYVGGDRLYAFAAECNSESCPPVWVGPRQSDPSLPEPRRWSLPAVRPNMVFSSTDRPYAFRAGCAEKGGECAPLWVGPPLARAALTAVGVSDRLVVLTASDGSIRAFAVTADS
jgi:outer membrane protein assembly factor BamB